MSNPVNQQIQQILLKPHADVVLSDTEALTERYLLTLVAALSEQEWAVALDYVRPMSRGVHVLRVEPALSVAQSKQLTELLTNRDDVEYAEPDLPRQR